MGEGTICLMWHGLVLPPLNDMEVPAHISNGRTKDAAMETPNPLVDGKSISMFQMEGAQNFTPPTNNIEGFNISINNNIWTFWYVSLSEGLNSTKKQDLDKKWVTFFNEVNIPFNVVWHLAFIEVVKATYESSSWTYYKPSSYHGLHINLLKQSKMDVFKQVTKRTWNLIHKYGTNNYFNGWDNVTRHPLLNIMFVCQNGNVFIGSIYTTREWKDAHYICNVLVGYIKPLELTTLYKFV